MLKRLSFLFLAYVAINANAINNTDNIKSPGFSPGTVCQKNIINLINASEYTINFAIYSFTDEKIYNALLDAKNKGIKIKCVYDKTQAKNKSSKIQDLIDSGIDCVQWDKNYLMHHKYLIIDNSVVLTGSYNWSDNAQKNSENCVLIKDYIAVDNFADNFTKFFLKN